jgi:hypothetical protein
MVDSSLPKPPRTTTVRQAVLTGALLVLIDAFLLNQGIIAGFVGAGLLVIGLPLALLKRAAPARTPRLRNLAIYMASVVLVFVLNAMNNRIAATRAEGIISSVKAFHAKNGRYPESLNNLVPEFLDHIPLAKYTLSQNRFLYQVTEGRAALIYVEVPPFGHPIYRFSEDKWDYMD